LQCVLFDNEHQQLLTLHFSRIRRCYEIKCVPCTSFVWRDSVHAGLSQVVSFLNSRSNGTVINTFQTEYYSPSKFKTDLESFYVHVFGHNFGTIRQISGKKKKLSAFIQLLHSYVPNTKLFIYFKCYSICDIDNITSFCLPRILPSCLHGSC